MLILAPRKPIMNDIHFSLDIGYPYCLIIFYHGCTLNKQTNKQTNRNKLSNTNKHTNKQLPSAQPPFHQESPSFTILVLFIYSSELTPFLPDADNCDDDNDEKTRSARRRSYNDDHIRA